MNVLHPALEAMYAAWNEHDMGKLQGHLERALTDDIEFCDPVHHIHGRAAFQKMVQDFRAKYPRAVCAIASGIDMHHDRCRYEWTVTQDGKVFPGMDVTRIDTQTGKVARVDGFFGPIPPKS